ncbi:MAG: FtsX-like permease family protein [Prevotella sp.]|nr:FtsX-like permease family protein [Prevotella sp.]MCM1074062.1 FtsX-like permease family protein [Ruminococcus sp.]
MSTSSYIARKLSLSSSDRKSSPAIKVAVISTALSMAVMLLAVSVVGGFRREIRNKVTGFDSHISIYPTVQFEEDETVVNYTPELRNLLKEQPYMKRADLLVTAPVLIKTDKSFKGLYMKGVEPNYDFSFIKNNLVSGSLPADTLDILVSTATANKLGVNASDSVNLFMSNDLRARKVKVAGIFNTHFESYDSFFAYATAPLVRNLTGLDSMQGASIEVTTDNIDNVELYNENLVNTLNKAINAGKIYQSLATVTVQQKDSHFFAWLDLLDINVWVILTLMTLVALFTLISGMLILILEKIRFIGVMRAIGARRSHVRNVFILLAVRVALIGMLIGGVLAIGLIVLQDRTHFIPLDPEAYYIDFVPVSLDPRPLVAVPCTFIILIWLALILPSQLAGRIRPTRTLRFE